MQHANNGEIQVSVIIPIYNTAKYLKECLDSVVNQTFKEIEIICVNDGSTDDSKDILNEYTSKYKCITVVNQTNQGPSVARNAGLAMATGEYIYFLDSDDYIDFDAFEKLVSDADRRHLDLIYIGCKVFYESDNTPKIPDKNCPCPLIGLTTGAELLNKLFEHDKLRITPGLFLRKAFLTNNHISFNNGMVHEDITFMFLCMINAKRAGHIPDIFYHWRIRKNSISNSPTSAERVRGYLLSCMTMLDSLKSISSPDEDVVEATKQYIGFFQSCTVENYNLISQQERAKFLSPQNFYERMLANLYARNEDLLNKERISANKYSQQLESATQANSNLTMQNNAITKQNNAITNEITMLKSSLNSIQNSLSFRIGRAVTWLPRKTRGAIHCYQEHGFIYTSTLFLTKILRKTRLAKRDTPLDNSHEYNTDAPAHEQLTSQQILCQDKQEEPQYDMGFYDRIKDKVAQMPESNGSRYYKPFDVNIGLITDEFMFHTFRDTAHCIAITPDNWRIEIKHLDILLIISGWEGLHSEWQGIAGKNMPARQIVHDIIDVCKNNKILTVFYSIEDPYDYDRFLSIAKRCDYVFTTASEVVEQYIKDCGHNRVKPLRFCCNPLFHNPIGSRKYEKTKDVLFAGSWYPHFPERNNEACAIFDWILKSDFGLKILDRYLSKNRPGFAFPLKYAKYISPPVSHRELQKICKLYNWAICLNSITHSPTMCANRAYELQASGVLQLSNYCRGIYNYLPLIFTCSIKDEIPRILNAFSDEEIHRYQNMGVRQVLNGDTCFDRMSKLLNTIGIHVKMAEKTVLVATPNINEVSKANFERQSYIRKQLILEKDLTEELKKKFDIIAFMNDESFYGIFYLEDMINAFKYTDCDYVTKDSYFESGHLHDGEKHNYVSIIRNKYHTIFWSGSFTANELLSLKENVYMHNGYSVDQYEYDSINLHTNNKTSATYKLSVIIPIFNNGWFLYGKAFSSLKRSSMFNDMEIIMVDDGSTDYTTINMIRYLDMQFDNVKTFFLDKPASGSPSRPRNLGISYSNSTCLTFLDPDNEAISDAYSKMYNIQVKYNYNIVTSNTASEFVGLHFENYYNYIYNMLKTNIINGDTREFLMSSNFILLSIQASIIKKEIITNNKLSLIVGGLGEDTLFGWQLITIANFMYYENITSMIYYGERNSSLTNCISPKFFQRSLLVEVAQKTYFEQVGLLIPYMQKHFNEFFREWYLNRLSMASANDGPECAKILKEIFDMYASYYDNNDEQINTFINYCQKNNFKSAFNFSVRRLK